MRSISDPVVTHVSEFGMSKSCREIRKLEGHTEAVRALLFIDGDRALVSGGDDGRPRLWGWQDGSGAELGQQGGRVVLFAERRSAGQVFSFSEFNFMMWDLMRFGTADRRFDWETNVLGMDPERLKILLQHTSINGDLFSLEVWDLEHPDPKTEKIDKVDTFSTYIRTATYTNSRGSIAAGLSDGSIKFYESMAAKARTLRGHRGEISALAPTAGGARLVSASHDGTLMLWDLTAEPENEPQRERDVYAVAFAPAGQVAVAGFSDSTVEIWDATARMRINSYTLQIPAFDLRIVDDEIAILGFASGRVGFLNIRTGELLHEAAAHSAGVMAVHVDSACGLAATASKDRRVKIWNVNQRRELMTLEGHEAPVVSVAVLPGGQHAVSGDNAGRCLLWDLTTHWQSAELRLTDRESSDAVRSKVKWELTGPEMRVARPHSCAVAALADGRHVAATAAGRLVIWDITTGRQVGILNQPSPDPAETLRLSNGGRLLAATTAQGSCDLWDVVNRRHLARFTFDSPNLVCDVGGPGPLLVAGISGLPREIAFLRLEPPM